jgi:hypothetical protein
VESRSPRTPKKSEKFHRGTRIDDVLEFLHFGISKDKSSRLLSQESQSHETMKESEPFVGRRTRVARYSLSGIRTSGFRKGSPSISRVVKSQENRSHPSRRIGGRDIGISRTQRFAG